MVKQTKALFINASEHFEKGKRQNRLLPAHIDKIIDTYQFRREEERYSMRVSMERIEKEGYNLNISRYISTAVVDDKVDLQTVNAEVLSLEQKITESKRQTQCVPQRTGLTALAVT